MIQAYGEKLSKKIINISANSIKIWKNSGLINKNKYQSKNVKKSIHMRPKK